MKIAILGATSEIAKDLIVSFTQKLSHDLLLFSRNPEHIKQWLILIGSSIQCQALGYEAFSADRTFDVIINFVGVGNPAKAVEIGSSIFEVTQNYDLMALNYLKAHPNCKYIFLSSGAAYGNIFQQPANESSQAIFPVNQMEAKNWYGLAKLYAETRHRAHTNLNITDVRVFNYFSATQDMSARFLISDAVRAIASRQILQTSAENIVRDYLGAEDFYQLISKILLAGPTNTAVDCYSQQPIQKFQLLDLLLEQYGLKYEVSAHFGTPNAYGAMHNYYSINRIANKFYGFEPKFTSAELVLSQSAIILKFTNL